jgi:hypothetical protein
MKSVFQRDPAVAVRQSRERPFQRDSAVAVRQIRATRIFGGVLAAVLAMGCNEAKGPEAAAPKSEAPKSAAAKGEAPKSAAAEGGANMSEIVFDPANPPPGYRNCHRNHCHHENGGVASYAQVMQEMGATRIVGAGAPPKLPDPPADVAAPPADAERTPSGLASKVITPGKGGRKPGPTSVVTVHYSGWTTDGKGFDSSVTRGQPARFPLNRVIAGWTEGLQLMVEGEERRFWIPVELAYQNRPGKPAGMLVFDVELLGISDP